MRRHLSCGVGEHGLLAVWAYTEPWPARSGRGRMP